MPHTAESMLYYVTAELLTQQSYYIIAELLGADGREPELEP